MEDIIAVASGKADADLIIKNGLVVNVFDGDVIKANVALKNGVIAGVGNYYHGKEEVDAAGRYLLPGLIDAHVHIESSLLTPAGFAAACVPHGTTAVIADPHEIVNVAGAAGLKYMIDSSRGLPLELLFMLPSCIPATYMETAGGAFTAGEMGAAFEQYPQSPGLGEMMNYPGVIGAFPEVINKIRTAKKYRRKIDGHAPLVSGRELNAYIAAGIDSEHECTSPEEAVEKLRLGMHILIREGSAAKNLIQLLPAVTDKNFMNFSFCCDDRHSADLVHEGHVDHILRKAVAGGMEPVKAVQLATINTARHYRLQGLGAIAPGYQANIVLVDNLEAFTVRLVLKNGRRVAENGRMLIDISQHKHEQLLHTVSLPELKGRFKLPSGAEGCCAHVIEVLLDQIFTRHVRLSRPDISGSREDLAKIAVVERYGKNGNVSLGLVKGFGIRRGALASTIAHDSHNLIIVGNNDNDMEKAAEVIQSMQGGIAVVAGGETLASMPLPVGGIMSELAAAAVAAAYDNVQQAAKRLGCSLPAPFMTMSFLALAVIPELKITDQGLVDVGNFRLIDLWEQR